MALSYLALILGTPLCDHSGSHYFNSGIRWPQHSEPLRNLGLFLDLDYQAKVIPPLKVPADCVSAR